ncbi:uncharacterized protein LOC111690995 [Lucilia cuprina]|uniref:uncharacterized protein LOC111690995 n=1 Tax=Lucilia cuprina TaxID=7375 RepID=UPI001F06887C|nr:uncharacterized protein LOC111690995 [Lucilia cuprina]XP_046806341.1 uncharacterized protein LOC111690995 [Lucilia cuprina]
MSCQQASRFITNSSNINHNNNNTHSNRNNHNNSNCKSLNNLSNNNHNNNNSNNIIKGNRNTRGVTVQQEDPYVFTESVPTTPPILFNTQKTRTRLNDLTSATTLSIGKLQQQQQKLPLTETNGKITTNSLKTQASFLSSSSSSTASSITTTNTCIAPTSKTNVIQSLTITATNNNTNNNNSNNSNSKKLTNVCIVRPQLQQQQPNYHHHHHQNYANATSLPSSVYEGDLKSISPPPLYTPPTPSLWQTPLLLESPAPQVTNVVVSPKPTITTTTTTSQTTPVMGCVTPTVQTVGSTTTIMNPSLTTTAMAKVAPIIVHTPFAQSHTPPPPAQSPNQQQCLPPSKFHNHTLAQHLHKVECLKKSKKSTEAEVIHCNDNIKAITEAVPSSFNAPIKAASLKTLDLAGSGSGGVTVKHSENEDLNEIPVNVIFRMAMVAQQNEKSSNNIQFVKPQTDIDLLKPSPTPPPQPPPPSSPHTTQLKTNMNKKLSIPASITIATNQVIKQQQSKQQINTSSIQNNATTTALNSQQQQQTANSKTVTAAAATANDDSKITTNSESLTKSINGDTTPTTNLKTKTSTHITNKTRKTNNALNTIATINLNYDLPYNWQMGCSTTKGAVAIVKMSQHHVDLDTTHLATATGLPYCLQQYWLNSYDLRKSCDLLLMDDKPLNRSLAREERIALYKRQLRRQAMQLISTRSLQKLPIQLARRRLMCVDRLLRKYQHSEQNKKELPANVKRCCVNGCDAYTLEMASHCQQHIVYNSAQHVFLPCTAKFADNTQCRVPVFDIAHDLPLCMEHARKRDAYNRLLYEQRPRKISTNPHIMNESKLLANNSSNKDTVMMGEGNGAEAGGVLIKTQHQYQQKQKPQKQQQKQQQQQHILQQLPANNNSNNGKRPTLVNQAARKRKMTTVGLTGNPVGRPQKRVKKSLEKSAAAPVIQQQMPRLTATSLKRKSSTTSLESIASNSQHSTTSSTSQQQQQQPQQQYQRQQTQQLQNLYGLNSSTTTNSSLPPPALAPLSGLVGHGFPQHLFSFGHDNYHHQNHTQQQHQQQLQPILNLNDKHSFSLTTSNTNTATPATTASTPTELKDFISQFSLAAQKQTQADSSNDVNLLNTNSNSNFTSSGMGSTTSLPTADDFLTQDMLSICENSSASSADTGLGGLSDPELMLGGPEDDIPLGDTHLLEEHDLENVLNSLPEDAFKELFTTVHQDESDEIERAIELADKHLKTLQQTIGSELGDFLDFNDDMLMDNGDLCNGSTANNILDTTALFIGSGGGGVAVGATIGSNTTQVGGGGAVIGTADIRGLVQT